MGFWTLSTDIIINSFQYNLPPSIKQTPEINKKLYEPKKFKRIKEVKNGEE